MIETNVVYDASDLQLSTVAPVGGMSFRGLQVIL